MNIVNSIVNSIVTNVGVEGNMIERIRAAASTVSGIGSEDMEALLRTINDSVLMSV